MKYSAQERADKTVTLQEQNIKEHKATSQGRACNNEIFCPAGERADKHKRT
jgi:hypothetical protein